MSPRLVVDNSSDLDETLARARRQVTAIQADVADRLERIKARREYKRRQKRDALWLSLSLLAMAALTLYFRS